MARPRASPGISALRFVGRYAIATAMIPVGVALGVGGLIQFWLRQRRSDTAPPAPGPDPERRGGNAPAD
jgi:hypothetical protein